MLQHYCFILIAVLQITFSASNYFCDLPCLDYTQHTPCGKSEACGENGSPFELTNDDRESILDVHNTLRNEIAVGADTTGGNGEAANMRVLNYNKELEFVAQCWANACKETGRDHDICRNTKDFISVGQNMYSTCTPDSSIDLRNKTYLTDAVTKWYSAIRDSNSGEIDYYTGKTKRKISQFTQVIWAETTHIGCGRTYYISSETMVSKYCVYIYCNYGPKGNVLKTPVYKRGRPCSHCDSLNCNDKYTGLCGNITDLESDKWTPPFITPEVVLKSGQLGLQSENSIYVCLILVTVLPTLQINLYVL